jgi:polyhydroxyalkanoate synthesis regulator phasin
MATDFEKGFHDIFLAGVGAMAITGEKAKEVLDTLIEKGGVTVEQGKDINRELQHKATEAVSKVRADTIAAAMKTMTAEERAEFAATVAKLAAEPEAEAQAEPAQEASEE